MKIRRGDDFIAQLGIEMNGIKYAKDLNSAARLNAGLDIIDTLSRVLGISVPI